MTNADLFRANQLKQLISATEDALRRLHDAKKCPREIRFEQFVLSRIEGNTELLQAMTVLLDAQLKTFQAEFAAL